LDFFIVGNFIQACKSYINFPTRKSRNDKKIGLALICRSAAARGHDPVASFFGIRPLEGVKARL